MSTLSSKLPYCHPSCFPPPPINWCHPSNFNTINLCSEAKLGGAAGQRVCQADARGPGVLQKHLVTGLQRDQTRGCVYSVISKVRQK